MNHAESNTYRKATGTAEVASESFRVLKNRCGYDWKQVSGLSRIPVATLKWQAGHGFPSRLTRARLESAFGLPIFSSPSAWRQRQVRKAILGLDPAIVTRDELRAISRRTGFKDWAHSPNKATLLRDLCAYLSANKHLRPVSPEPSKLHAHD